MRDFLYNDLFRYSYKVVEPEAPAAEESRSVAGRLVANIIQASAEKEVEEELAWTMLAASRPATYRDSSAAEASGSTTLYK